MRIYGITVTGRTIAANSDDMNLIRTSIGVDQLYVLFDSSEWMNFPVSVTFKNGDVMVTTSLLLAAVESTEWAAEATCTIPWEIIQELGSVNVTLQGTDSSGNHIITAEGAPLAVVEAGDVEEGTIPEGVPTISEWEQAYANAMAVVNEGTAIIEALDGFAGGTLPIENGGTGADNAPDALTNLGAAAATHNHSGQALTPASVAATGAVSGSSVSDSVGSLAQLRESVSQTISSGLTITKLAGWCYIRFSSYQVTASGSEAAGNIGFTIPQAANYPVAVEGVGLGWMNIRENGSLTLYNDSMAGYQTGTVHGSAVVPLR